ncbi:hypothetical protein DH2020_005462 [Rehmannia glutinosa]|uniref:Uncharacterized protein n=1 Tax=Rehmannia glutinosa TaxID=99300 RepID=A0ABR0XG25_REHGL
MLMGLLLSYDVLETDLFTSDLGLSGQSFAVSVVPRYTLARASDLFAQTPRFSSLLTQNARGISQPPEACKAYMDRYDIAAEAVKKRRRATKKPYSRSIVGATLEVIQKRRAEKPEVRDAAREAAFTNPFNDFVCKLSEIKERIKKTKDEKKAKKAETISKQKTSKGNVSKGAGPKGPKIGGGGGKR